MPDGHRNKGKKTKKTTSKKKHERKQNLEEEATPTVKPNSSPVTCTWIARVPRSPLDRASLVEI